MNIPRFTYGLASDTGISRATNQDAASAILISGTSDFGILDMGLFMVADGMGADEDGKKAAQIAIDTVAAEITTHIFQPLIESAHDDINLNLSSILTAAVQKANARVLKLPQNAAGCTLTAALLIGERLYIAHVGDSRAYRFVHNQITQLTEDHTLVNRLVQLGQITWDKAKIHPVDGNLRRALGWSEDLEVDIIVEHFQKSSHLLLCTGGLIGWDWDYVKESELQTILQHSDPQTACNRLITLSMEHASPANLTALVVKSSDG
jgi:PPM family protein phosphatase